MILLLLFLNYVFASVVELNDSNFDTVVLDTTKDVFVKFYAPWCGHCKSLAPVFDEVAEELKTNEEIVIAKLDATAFPTTASKFNVNGYPTLLFFKKTQKTNPEKYSGARSKEELIRYVTGAPEPPTDVTVLTQENFDSIALDKSKDVLVEFYAPWCGACKSLAPVYESVAKAFKNEENVVVAKVDATVHTNLAEKYNVRAYPTLVFFPRGETVGEPYIRGQSLEGFVSFLNERANTQRAPDGSLLPNSFKLKLLDKVVAALEDSSDITAELPQKLQLVAEVFKGDAREDVVKKYIEIVDKVVKEGKQYISTSFESNSQAVSNEEIPAPERKKAEQILQILTTMRGIKKLRVKQLRSYAKDHGIDISGAAEAGDIKKIIIKNLPTGQERVALTEEAVQKAKQLLQAEQEAAAKKAAAKAERLKKEQERLERKKQGKAVTTLNAYNFERIVMDATKHVFVEFFAPWCGHCKQLAPIWEEAAVEAKQNHPDVVFANLDASYYEKVAQKYGVTSFPTLKFFSKEGKENATYEGPRTKSALLKYAVSGGLEEEEEIDESEKSEGPTDVVVLNRKNFKQIVMDSSKDVLVEFYAPWCGHCKSLAPTYEEVAKEFKDTNDVVIAKLNADFYKSTASSYVKGFPTIIYFTKENKNGLEYKGGRSKEDIVKFVKSRGLETEETDDEEEEEEEEDFDEDVVTLTSKNFDRIVNDETKTVLVKFYAPWCGHCKSMAKDYEDAAAEIKESHPDVILAELDATKYGKVAEKFGVSGYPTLKLFTKTDKKSGLDYNGPRTKEALIKFATTGKE